MALSQAEYKLLDKVDTTTGFLVYGFVRELEQFCGDNIPVSIIQICILFF